MTKMAVQVIEEMTGSTQMRIMQWLEQIEILNKIIRALFAWEDTFEPNL